MGAKAWIRRSTNSERGGSRYDEGVILDHGGSAALQTLRDYYCSSKLVDELIGHAWAEQLSLLKLGSTVDNCSWRAWTADDEKVTQVGSVDWKESNPRQHFDYIYEWDRKGNCWYDR